MKRKRKGQHLGEEYPDVNPERCMISQTREVEKKSIRPRVNSRDLLTLLRLHSSSGGERFLVFNLNMMYYPTPPPGLA